jgi:hypothetical protein
MENFKHFIPQGEGVGCPLGKNADVQITIQNTKYK